MLIQLSSTARLPAIQRWHAGIPALGIVLDAGRWMPMTSLLSHTCLVQRSAVDHLQLAITPVPELVMTAKSAVLVFQLVRFAALILNALYAVTNLVRHAWRNARGLVSTKETVLCRAPHRVTVFHVTNAAPDVSPAHTSVLGYAAKNALNDNIARYVRTKRTSVWISSK